MAFLVYILTGSNMGNPSENLKTAIELIGQSCGKISNTSSIYKTAAWGNTSQNAFLNQVIVLETLLEPLDLLQALLHIETQMGRIRNEKWEPRVIDIDILFYEQRVLNEASLILPHPYIQQRKFTLIPLVEIAPTWVHPVLHKTMEELLATCEDPLLVEKLDVK